MNDFMAHSLQLDLVPYMPSRSLHSLCVFCLFLFFFCFVLTNHHILCFILLHDRPQQRRCSARECISFTNNTKLKWWIDVWGTKWKTAKKKCVYVSAASRCQTFPMETSQTATIPRWKRAVNCVYVWKNASHSQRHWLPHTERTNEKFGILHTK